MSNSNADMRTMSVHAIFQDDQRRAHLAAVLCRLNAGKSVFVKMSWREMAAWFTRYYGVKFNYATLRRYAMGDPVVNPEHCIALGLQPYVKAHSCPLCHQAPTVCLCDGRQVYDANTHTPVRKPGTGRNRHRAEIYPGTPPAVVIAKLAALGHDVSYNEGELEY